MEKQQSNYILLTLLIVLMIGMYVFFIAQSNESTAYFAKNGVLQLKNSDFIKHGIIETNGKWKFYKNTLESDINDKTSYIIKQVPDFWEDDKNMNNSPYGIGSYRLQIKGLKPRYMYGIEVLDEVTAYNLYSNNKLIMSNGIINKYRSKYVPQWHSQASVFETDKNGEAEIIMEIENFDYAKFIIRM